MNGSRQPVPVVDRPGVEEPEVPTEEQPEIPEKDGSELPVQRALLSVSERDEAFLQFARDLVRHGAELIATRGTCRDLQAAGIPVKSLEEVIGFTETLDGRVKTLHPSIHIGILADRDDPGHMRELAEAGIEPIDLVCVHLYPFEQHVQYQEDGDPTAKIDIGGSAMLRAAGKNHECVVPVSSLLDYHRVIAALERTGGVHPSISRRLAVDAFKCTARHDDQIAKWLEPGDEAEGPDTALQES
ncbi:MAG TPA: hypothetical protein VIF43_02210 [Patescibacteria group bacterium]|jgi:phosphoribosylaminoimidazolecarboxamide formyltransferase/IMP cyclohydrolase